MYNSDDDLVMSVVSFESVELGYETVLGLSDSSPHQCLSEWTDITEKQLENTKSASQ